MISVYGQFNDVKNKNTYYVSINNLGSGSGLTSYEIDETSDKIAFDFSEPVVIETDYSDTFVHVIIKQATINLVVNDNFKDAFFSGSDRNIIVTIGTSISNGVIGDIIFKGYVDPLMFQEPFEKDWTKFQLSCSDTLATLQYKKYPDLTGVDPIAQASPISIINKITDYLNLTLDITLLSDEVKDILNNTLINNSIFFGDSPDDWKYCNEVLEEIGRYCEIWFSQEGESKLRCFPWHDNTKREDVRFIMKEDFAGSDTNISVSDVYTQIKLTCKLEKQDNLVEFGSDDLKKKGPKFKYMEEYVTEGTGASELRSFFNMVKSYSDTYIDNENVYKLDCYAQLYESQNWIFPTTNYLDVFETNDNNPNSVLSWLYQNPGKAAFVGFGKTEKKNRKDNGVLKSPTLTDSLIISVGGTDNAYGQTMKQKYSGSYICRYVGNSSTFTPPSNDIINYIVISGNILLNPLYAKSAPLSSMHNDYFGSINGGLYLDSLHTFTDYRNILFSDNDEINHIFKFYARDIGGAVPYRDGYYLQRPLLGEDTDSQTPMIFGDLKWDNYQKQWKYNNCMINGQLYEGVDYISKIPILICQFKVGDKYCVERTDRGTKGWNQFEWMTAQQASLLGLEPVFSIGIDPKIEDTILGTEHKISDTVSITTGLEGTGTAIPIKASDMLHGEFEFKILRPADVQWNHISFRYHGWWITKHRITDSDWFPVMEKLSSILVKNLKMELKSNKANITDLNEDGDLVYASNENSNYIEEHEEETIFATMLTSYECTLRDVDIVLSPSHLIYSNGSPYLGMSYTTQGSNKIWIKPEDMYVNNFYEEYSEPRTVIETTLDLNNQYSYIIKPYSHRFRFNNSYYKESGNFVPVSFEAKLREDKVKYTMKNMS